MPGDCPASLHILLFVCGKHSAPSRTPFRYQAKTVRLATGIGVQLQTGIAFTFDRISRRFSAILTLSAYELLFSFSSPKEKGQFLDLVRSNEDLETTTSKMTLWCPPLKRFGMLVRS